MRIGGALRTAVGPVLELRDFRLIWSAGAVSSLGSIFFDFTLLWYVAVELQSVVATSLVVTASSLLSFILGLPSGALADRFDRRRLMVGMDLARFALVLFLPLLYYTGQLSLPLILLIAFARSTADVFFYPAEQSLIASSVPQDRLSSANSYNVSSQQLIGAIGPVVAGVLINVSGPIAAFFIDADTFAVSAMLITRITKSPDSSPAEVPEPFSWSGLLADVRGGGAYIWTTKPLRIDTLVAVISIFGFAAFRPIGLLFFQNQLGMSAATYGVVSSIGILGLAVGSATRGVLIARTGAYRVFAFAFLVLAVTTVVVALVTTNAMIAALIAVRSVGIGLVNVSTITILQRHSMNAFSGRVFATVDTISEGGRPIALVAGAGLADLTTPRMALVLTRGAFLAAAVVATRGFPFDHRIEESGDREAQ